MFQACVCGIVGSNCEVLNSWSSVISLVRTFTMEIAIDLGRYVCGKGTVGLKIINNHKAA